MLTTLIGLIPGAASIASGGWGLLLAALSNQWIRLGIVGLAVYVYADLHGRSAANAACHEAAVRADNAILARDLAIRTRAADDATRRAISIEADAKKNQERVHELETAIDAKPAAAQCRAGSDDLRRLRAIR